MQKATWIKHHKNPSLGEPIAVVGSPGLRSIGSLVIDYLLNEIQPELIAELYSKHFPLIYQTKPSYASHPELPGIAGIQLKSGEVDLPKVQFYCNINPPLIITKGYHPNFEGQYDVAERVLNLYTELRVKRLIVVAGYGSDGRDICCAATSQMVLDEIKRKFDLEIGYEGPFYGFSGVVFGLAKLWGIEAICLFGKTDPIPEDPQRPDEKASKILLNKLIQMLNLSS